MCFIWSAHSLVSFHLVNAERSIATTCKCVRASPQPVFVYNMYKISDTKRLNTVMTEADESGREMLIVHRYIDLILRSLQYSSMTRLCATKWDNEVMIFFSILLTSSWTFEKKKDVNRAQYGFSAWKTFVRWVSRAEFIWHRRCMSTGIMVDTNLEREIWEDIKIYLAHSGSDIKIEYRPRMKKVTRKLWKNYHYQREFSTWGYTTSCRGFRNRCI